MVRDWQDAPALVLSCPGPMRRHTAALLPLGQVALPQVFLGGESQFLAFAASVPELAGRLFFAPLPEMFADPSSLRAAWRATGHAPPAPGDIVHLRFGSVRDARVLKGARNAAIIAEAPSAPVLTASRHPFATGHVLPAAIQGLFTYGPHTLRPRPIGGGALPETQLPAAAVTADLEAAIPRKPPRTAAPDGLDLVSLAEYSATEWAAGAVRPASPPARPAVLLPWNLAHFGSVVPELLRRLVTLHRPDAALPAIVILPYNYLGLTGIIRALIKDLRAAAETPDPLMNALFLARVTQLRGLAPLKSLSRTVWIDGGDPEAWWTQARFAASGFDTILLGSAAHEGGHFPADDPVRIETATRFGKLAFDARVPALRALPQLLALTAHRPRRRSTRASVRADALA